MSLKVVKFAAKKKDMIQLAEGTNSPKWYWMSSAVQGFAHKAIKAGDEVTIEGNEEKDNLTIITRISKAGAGSSQKKETTKSDTGFKCEDCKCDLKDGKYKKCFKCNEKNPSKSTGGGYSKSPEDSERITRLSILSSVCQAVTALVGNVDRNDIGDVINSLYDKFYEKISK